PMERITELRAPGVAKDEGNIFAIENHAEPVLASLRYRLKDSDMQVAEEVVGAGGKKFDVGTVLLKAADRSQLESAIKELGLRSVAMGAVPNVKSHPLRAARILLLHSWLGTQTEGWWRLALDKLQIPYDYASTQTIAATADLREKYDVILFPPVGWGGSLNSIINGLPTEWGNPLPWQNTPETPNLVGKNDATADLRPGLGWDGVAQLQKFVNDGGVFLTVMDTSQFAAAIGISTGVSSSN